MQRQFSNRSSEEELYIDVLHLTFPPRLFALTQCGLINVGRSRESIQVFDRPFINMLFSRILYSLGMFVRVTLFRNRYSTQIKDQRSAK